MRISTLFLVAALVTGCAKGPELEPAPGARVTNGEAFDSAAGVKVTVNPKNWYGLDLEGEEDLVRLHVSIENDSGKSLHLAYDHFMLVGDNGRTWRAIDPSRPDMVDLHLMDELLERHTLEPAVEGELENVNDTIAGYLYFNEVDTANVTFQMDLVDANTGRSFGEIEIPFVVEDFNRDMDRRDIDVSAAD